MGAITPLARAIFESQRKQIAIAKLAGIHETRLSKIVNGHVAATEDEQEALAKALELPRPELFPDSEHKEKFA